MKTPDELKQHLLRLDGRGYKAYKEIKGAYAFADFTLHIDHVQGDPFAIPSRFRIEVPQSVSRFPEDLYRNRIRRIALADTLTRQFSHHAKLKSEHLGSGKSGQFEIDSPGQEVLERTALSVDATGIVARFFVGLPARGRRILGRQAEEMICNTLPEIVQHALIFINLNPSAVRTAVETVEDAEMLRSQLNDRGLVAFIAEGSILPRKSGVNARPLEKNAVPFQSPPSLRQTLQRCNQGPITGMGISKGVTLIVGGGYHGKSTLLRAIEYGVYNHFFGDGREFVVSDFNTVKIRSEDGRSVSGLDLSPFINNLPQDQSTTDFSSNNASGSTSQAANITEALEVDAKVLLIDEDTAATNFMIRDHRMQELIAKHQEPITPFIDKVRQLYTDYGVSSILVIGGSGDYFDVADTVIAMSQFSPGNLSSQAKKIARKYASERTPEGSTAFGSIRRRIPLPESLNPGQGNREHYLRANETRSISFGRERIDLSAVEQIVEKSQVRAIAHAMLYAKNNYMDEQTTFKEITGRLLRDLQEKGLDLLMPRPYEDLACFRKFEWIAALNRLRTLKITSTQK
ncbi:MAG: ABC-ATPase domain-containing protein [Nitrospiria bacterium]